ncbi:MAG: glycerate kinase [Opitutaceae bacterium]|nr:glycerate kinase [Opitutaceae bacterium]
MRILIAFDKFKGSLSAPQACELAARALRQQHRDWRLDLCPLTDGGEGFTDILTKAAGGRMTAFKVTGPRGGLVDACLGLVAPHNMPAPARQLLHREDPEPRPEKPIAVMEMAAASGLGLLAPEYHDPWQTTTYGTGQLIRAAAELQADAILLGVGGSATNDLGLGALAALGLEFRGVSGEKIRPPIPATWKQIGRLDGEVFPALPPIYIACDVTNPLLGPRGAAAVYGPQKGLRREDLPQIESLMEHMARMLGDYCGRPFSLAETAGTGAAGGLPFGLLTGARARLVPGFGLVSAWLDLKARIAAADMVMTGEGCFDESSLSGKGPGAVAKQAQALGKTVHIFAGKHPHMRQWAGWHLHPIAPAGYSLEQAVRETSDLLARNIQAVFSNTAAVS